MIYTLSLLTIFIVSLFGLHFISLSITKFLKKRIPSKRHVLFSNKRFRLYMSGYPNMMIDFEHYSSNSIYDYDRNFSHGICIEYGGFNFWIFYGHDFLNDTFSDERSIYYGLYSLDSEWFWQNIWWGNHLYNNPFLRISHIGDWVYDINNKRLIEYDYDNIPFITCLKDTNYTCKDNSVMKVDKIKFYICESRFTFPILKKLKITNRFFKRIHYIDFIATGVGVEENWKGNVTHSSIKFDKSLEKAFRHVLKNPNIHTSFIFTEMVKERINRFMNEDKKY